MDGLTNLITFHNLYVYQIIMLYTSNLHNGICQLYLNKRWKNRERKKKVYNYRRKSLKNYINFVVEALVIEEKEKGV